MEYGLSTYLFVNERLTSHILDQMLGTGISHFEIFAARQHMDYSDPNHARDLAYWFRDHDINLHSVHAPLYADSDWGRSGGLAVSVAYLERRLRVDSMDEIKRVVEIADQIPFRHLVLHMGLPGEEYEPAKFDAAMTSLEHLRVFAKERGVQLLLENIPNELSTPQRLVEFIRYTRLGLKICLDIGHANMTCGVSATFDTLRDYVASTHVHDNHGEKDDHLMPFDGDIDWAAAAAELRRGQGQFPVLFEVRNGGSRVKSLKRLADVIRRMETLAEQDAKKRSNPPS